MPSPIQPSPLPLTDHFRRFFEADPSRLHFAAHSHHPWPDVTLAAQQQAWDDAARLADEKWDVVFEKVWPEAQGHLARELGLPDPTSLVFGPNTHGFVLRLLSCLPHRARVVTTDSEFHSFERQVRRLEEDGLLEVERVPSEPFDTFEERYVQAVKKGRCDLAFFSQVFFNSGAAVRDVEGLVRALPEGPMVVVDGYHGFLARPCDLSGIAGRAFYLAGGYKYAMSGEGACFLHVPPNAPKRPPNTGWFAAFGALEGAVTDVPYAPDGMRFCGATFDVSGLYRLNAVMRWRSQIGLTTQRSMEHAHALQRRLVALLSDGAVLKAGELVVPVEDPHRGHFLTFRRPDARALTEKLKSRRVITDARDDRFRLGFGVYQGLTDVERLAEHLREIA